MFFKVNDYAQKFVRKVIKMVVGRDEIDSYLRKYKLDEVLYQLAEVSQAMLREAKAIRQVKWNRRVGGLAETKTLHMPAFALADIAYRAIKHSNDHRQKIPNYQDICWFSNLLAKATDVRAVEENQNRDIEKSKRDIFLGLSQTQFWYQDIVSHQKKLYYNFLRYYLLLTEIANEFTLVNPDEDLRAITGFGIEDFSKLLFAIYAWIRTENKPELTPGVMTIDRTLTDSNPILTQENILRCAEFFTGDYQYYRQTGYPNNPLFFKPIVRTQSGRLIIANAFVWCRKFYEGVYWLLRDKYFQEDSTDFTTAFGEYYEKYVEKMLDYYLEPGSFRRIEEEGRADWLIYTDKYLIIVEQKSSLMSIALKKKYPSGEQFDEYLKILKKGCHQLNETENYIDAEGRTKIKIILTFEKLYFIDAYVKPKIDELYSSEIASLERCYFADTEDFEQLIQVIPDDIDAFNKIIETKIEYENNPPAPAEGRDLKDVISKVYGWRIVRFLEDYRHLFHNLVQT